MRSFVFGLLVLFLAIPCGAQAGAWLRDKATGFVSLSFGATQFSETTNSIYIEYGLSDETTVGLDISAFTNSQNVRNGYGNLFIRRQLGWTDGQNRWAYEIGLGGLWGNEMQRPTLKAGLSWGRGLQLGKRNGWINIDGGFIAEPTLGEHISKLDGTLGMELGEIVTGLLEITLSHQNSETFGAIEPSLLFHPNDSQFDIKLGTQIPIDDMERSALKLGIWHRF